MAASQQPEPISPMTALAGAAAAMHELYRSYVDAGFTEEQALQIVIAMIVENIRGARG